MQNQQSNMLYYLAGPMSGHPDFNYKAFEDAVWRLRRSGIQVISPHEINAGLHDLSQKESRAQRNVFLKNNISALMIYNGVLLLPGWEKSKGVEIELRIAKAFGMHILSLTDDYCIQDEQA